MAESTPATAAVAIGEDKSHREVVGDLLTTKKSSEKLEGPKGANLYKYTPLPDEPGAFRLLEKKGSFGEPPKLIAENLNNFPTVGGSCEKRYVAISYTWGGPGRTPYLLEDGEVYIPSSLLDALADIGDDYIWADSICINQQDDKEKSIQVKQMADVYKHSASTIVYLYPQELKNFSSPRSRFSDSKMSVPAVRPLLGHPWFTRAWIFQEKYHATKVEVQCGQQRRPWDQIDWILNYPIEKRPMREILMGGDPEGIEAIQKWLCREDWSHNNIWTKNEQQVGLLKPKNSWRLRPRTSVRLEEVMLKATPEEKEEERSRALEGLRLLAKMDAIGRPSDGNNNLWLLKVLQFRRGAGCFLPCDIVYAHLQLTEDREFADMINYTLPYNTALHGVAECFIRSVTGLWILAFVEDVPFEERQRGIGTPDGPVLSGNLARSRYGKLASWAPNWNRRVPADQDAFLTHLMSSKIQGVAEFGSLLNWRYCTMSNFFQIADQVICCVGFPIEHTVLPGDSDTARDTAVFGEAGDAVLSGTRLLLPRSYLPGDMAFLLADAPEAVHFVRPAAPGMDSEESEEIVRKCIRHRRASRSTSTCFQCYTMELVCDTMQESCTPCYANNRPCNFGRDRFLPLEGLGVRYCEYVGQSQLPNPDEIHVDAIMRSATGNEILVLAYSCYAPSPRGRKYDYLDGAAVCDIAKTSASEPQG